MISGEGIRYFDFHTHRNKGTAETVAIFNLMAGDDIPADFPPNTLFSAGMHPWKITAENLKFLQSELLLTAAHPHVVMIGEAGFDHLRGPSSEVQKEAFHFQAALAEEMGKPLIIHCVRGWEELVKARRETNPSLPWIIHGFMGGKKLAATLAGMEFRFSLGFNGLNPQLKDVISTGSIMLETDDSSYGIHDVYKRFSEVWSMDSDQVTDLIMTNFKAIFGFTL